MMGDVDLLKMDIEGSEYEVLFATDPGLRSRTKRMVIEYHNLFGRAPYTKDDIVKYSASAGMRLIKQSGNENGFGVMQFAR